MPVRPVRHQSKCHAIVVVNTALETLFNSLVRYRPIALSPVGRGQALVIARLVMYQRPGNAGCLIGQGYRCYIDMLPRDQAFQPMTQSIVFTLNMT